MKNLLSSTWAILTLSTSLSLAGVTLTTLGQDANDYITLCPGDNYILAFQCVVTESLQFQWSLVPLLSRHPFGQNIDIGKQPQTESQVTLVLTEKEITQQTSFYESQLQVATGDLIQQLLTRDELEVFCGTFTEPKRTFIRMSGMTGNPPIITNTYIDKARKEVFVEWFTDIPNLVSITVIAKNTGTGREYRSTVGSNDDDGRAYIAICNPTDTFNVTVVVFDKCQNFRSNSTLVYGEGIESKTSLVPTQTVTALSSCYPSPNVSQFVIERRIFANEATYVGFGVALGFAVMMTIVVLAFAIVFYKRGGHGSKKEIPLNLSVQQPPVNDNSDSKSY